MLPIYLLHGFAGCPATWSAVIHAWPGAPVPIALPLPGHERNHPVMDSWQANVDWIASQLPGDAIVIGYSMGARLALGLLAADRVRAAVLIAGHTGLCDDAERAARAAADAAWAALLRERGLAAFAAAWEAQPLFASQHRAPAEARQQRRRLRLERDPEQLARSLEVIGLAQMPDLQPALLARAARVHLVVGCEDTAYVARAQALVAAAKLSTLGLDVLPQCGHDPTLEQPVALAAVAAAAAARLGR